MYEISHRRKFKGLKGSKGSQEEDSYQNIKLLSKIKFIWIKSDYVERKRYTLRQEWSLGTQHYPL